LGALGREFVVIPTLISDPALPNLKKQYDRLRILSVNDNTKISIKNNAGVTFDTTLNKGKVYELDFNSASYINSINPIIVCLFTSTMTYKSSGNKYGDLVMIWVNPIEQNLTDIIFTALPTTRVQKHYVNIVTKSVDHASTLLDGVSIASKCIEMAANKDYTYAIVEIANLNVPHQIVNPSGFSAYVYGYCYVQRL
ncbi:MAG: IgGFc-binding protein, partial [Prevotellaceae bacterium]|jgi:hypothetical protein|nr:IgGFc-binding protein [Prevotellaceae bacterium]